MRLPAMEKPTIRGILSKLRFIHHQRVHLLLITMVLLYFQWDFPVQSYELLNANNTQFDFDRTQGLSVQSPLYQKSICACINLFTTARIHNTEHFRRLCGIARPEAMH